MNKTGLLFLLALSCMGCDDKPRDLHKIAANPAPVATPSNWVTCQGTIWLVTQAREDHENVSHVVIAADDGTVFTVNLADAIPPAVQGLHGIFAYEGSNRERGLYKNFFVKQRL